MSTTRRKFIKFRGLLILTTYLGCNKKTSNEIEITESSNEEQLINYFKAKGFKLFPKHDLITNHDFNHGLRYDDEPNEVRSGKWMRFQDCGRVEDISNSNKPGVLAYFHILALNNDKPKFQGEMLSEVLDYLFNDAGLDPRKIILVSTDWINPYKTHIYNFNINSSQIIIRPYREVIAKGDGSGLFSVKGHPYNPNLPSVSIHYIIDNKQINQNPVYHSIQHLEICEISLNVGPKREKNSESAGIGMERLKKAQGHTVNSYSESKNRLILALENEAISRNIDLPNAYKTFN